MLEKRKKKEVLCILDFLKSLPGLDLDLDYKLRS